MKTEIIPTTSLLPGDVIPAMFGSVRWTVQAVAPAPLHPDHYFVVMVDSTVTPGRDTTFQADLSHKDDKYEVVR